MFYGILGLQIRKASLSSLTMESCLPVAGKFKSGIKNFKTSLEPISSEELLELLNSKDHESEVGGDQDQEVISDADLKELLDRSDLERRWRSKQQNSGSGEITKMTVC